MCFSNFDANNQSFIRVSRVTVFWVSFKVINITYFQKQLIPIPIFIPSIIIIACTLFLFLPFVMDEDIRYQRLPQSFSVRELGSSEARGLWGIKHTRKPVDLMVAKAKSSSTPLQPHVELRITEDGCEIIGDKFRKNFPIHTVSYGVQDLVYTRVFCMIVVKEQMSTDRKPFDCVAFVCESRQAARNLTYTLATAFQAYSRKVRSTGTSKSRFAIDLRTADELEMDLKKVDSEA